MGEVEHVAPPNESQMGRASKTQGLGGRSVSHGLEGRPCIFIGRGYGLGTDWKINNLSRDCREHYIIYNS